jgi:hypothetical protein
MIIINFVVLDKSMIKELMVTKTEVREINGRYRNN